MNIAKIKSWAKSQSLSQAGLARILGISATAVMKVYKGGGKFSRDTFATLVEKSGGVITWEDYAPQKKQDDC